MHLRLTLDHRLAVAELQRIDDACDRFESAWRGGDQPELGVVPCRLRRPGTDPALA